MDTYIHTYIHTCMHAYTKHTYIHAKIHTLQAYIHTCITSIHTYIHTLTGLSSDVRVHKKRRPYSESKATALKVAPVARDSIVYLVTA